MISNKNIFQLLAFSLVLLISGCNASDTETSEKIDYIAELKVYKSPTCSCCSKWINHMNDNGFLARHNNTNSLSFIKSSYGVPEKYRSCHTAVTEDRLVFEGHIPAKFIEQFLKQKPEGQVGLIVPGMPVGSPGMEYKDKFNPYTIMSFDSEGVLTPYADVLTYEEQFE